VEVHSGYDFPWSLNNWVPFWGGAEFHDYHHMAFTGNYASTFTLWDWVFGTDEKCHTWKAKEQADAAKTALSSGDNNNNKNNNEGTITEGKKVQ